MQFDAWINRDRVVTRVHSTTPVRLGETKVPRFWNTKLTWADINATSVVYVEIYIQMLSFLPFSKDQHPKHRTSFRNATFMLEMHSELHKVRQTEQICS